MDNNIGILDPEGKNPNPITDLPFSETYRELAKKWSSLPVYELRTEIMNSVRENQIVLISAATGSGKSVLTPLLVFHLLNYKGRIAMTLPKQIIVKAAAEYASKILEVELGKEIGYQYKGSPKNARSQDTKIFYLTDGTLRARLLKDPLLKDFDAVIIDEAHERKVQIDFLLYQLRETCRKRPEFRLIIMSATINEEIFQIYFSDMQFKVINVGGKRAFPIESIFLLPRDESLNYDQILDRGYQILVEILRKKPDDKGANDILFFVTSANETIQICNRLTTTPDIDFLCIEVYAGINPDKQVLAQDRDLYKKVTKFRRKVVLATNVAESSLTIDGIKYVIDSGYELKGKYDPQLRAKTLDRQRISQAQAKQRMGRAGRTEAGICYHLYTKNFFENIMHKYPEPEIRTNDISNDCLDLLSLPQIGSVENLLSILTQFIEPPTEDYVRDAIAILMQLGLIINSQISEEGLQSATVNGTSVMDRVTTLTGFKHNCLAEITAILGMLEACKRNIGELFISPKRILDANVKLKEEPSRYRKTLENLIKKEQQTKNKFKSKYGDHYSLLKIFDRFNKLYKDRENNPKKLNDWIYKYFLKKNVLEKARQLAKNSYNNNKRALLKIKDKLSGKQKILSLSPELRTMYCLQYGNRINIAHKAGDSYRTKNSKPGMKIQLSKNSFLLLNKSLPKEIFYSELFISLGKPELNILSKILTF